MSAYEELVERLNGEAVEAIVFGDWGWGGYSEPDEKPIKDSDKGKILTLEEAKPLMQGWSFNTGYGSPEIYAVYVWTKTRVIYICTYDGSSWLTWVPRNPIAVKPSHCGSG